MEKPIKHHAHKHNEFVVVGLAVSTKEESKDVVTIESEIQVGKYNEPIHFYEHFLAAVR